VSDYESTQKKRNIVVGIFVLVGLCAFVWLVFKFGDLPTAVGELNSFMVIVQFPSAKGIQQNAPVEFCGYQIGRVTNVMSPQPLKDLITGVEYFQTKVVLSIDNTYVNIPSNVDAKLMTRSLGSSYIELVQDVTKPILEPNQPYLNRGIVLQGSTGMTSEFFPAESQKKLVTLIDGINELVANANDIIGSQANKDNFKQILVNLTQATGDVQETLDKIRKLADAGTSTIEHANSKIDQISSDITDASRGIQKFTTAGATTIENVSSQADTLVASLVETTVQLNQAINELHLVLEKANTGDGTFARILNDGTAYENLIQNTEQLQLLLKDMEDFVEKWRDKKIDVKLKLF
jgi:ABC-type transporter Mla subunit MlaD